MSATHRAPGTIKRTSGIGGSDIAVLCGLSKYRTPYELYLLKRGELLPDESDSERMRFGRRFEKPIADEFSFRTGRKIWRAPKTLRHPEYKFILGNVDRFQERDGVRGVYEGKNHDWRMRAGWLSGGVPDAHYLQLQHYLLVTGCSFGSFGVLFGGNELHYFDIERDENTIASLLALELDFWRRVKDGEPPDYTFGQAGADLAKRLYAKAESRKAIILEGVETEVKIKRLLSLKAAVKNRESEITDIETWLKLQLGDAEVATFFKLAKITWGNSSRKTINLERLRSEHPAIAEALTEEKSSRRFLVSATDPEAIEEDTTPDQPFSIISSGVRQIDFGE